MTDETAAVRVNGVDLTTLTRLAGEVDTDPDRAKELARYTRSARVRWISGLHSQAYVRDARPHGFDEPEWLGGSDAAMAASEALLGAIGGCIATGFAANAALREVEVRELEIEVEGEIDLPTFFGLRDGDAGYDDVRVRILVDCDAEGELLEEIARRAVDLSPVVSTIRRPVDVHVDLEALD